MNTGKLTRWYVYRRVKGKGWKWKLHGRYLSEAKAEEEALKLRRIFNRYHLCDYCCWTWA